MKTTKLLQLKTLLFFISILLFQNSFGQTKYDGYLCTGVDKYSALQYTREYKENGDTFTTLYKVHSSRHGHYLNITATHYKSDNKIVVSIDDITVRGGVNINTEEYEYDTPTLEWFGRRGSFQSQYDAQGRLPNDLALNFISNKFENVKVVHVTGGHDLGMGVTKWYVLDED